MFISFLKSIYTRISRDSHHAFLSTKRVRDIPSTRYLDSSRNYYLIITSTSFIFIGEYVLFSSGEKVSKSLGLTPSSVLIYELIISFNNPIPSHRSCIFEEWVYSDLCEFFLKEGLNLYILFDFFGSNKKLNSVLMLEDIGCVLESELKEGVFKVNINCSKSMENYLLLIPALTGLTLVFCVPSFNTLSNSGHVNEAALYSNFIDLDFSHDLL